MLKHRVTSYIYNQESVYAYEDISILLQPVVPTHDSVTQLFHKHAGEDGKMDYKELRNFLLEATEKGLYICMHINNKLCFALRDSGQFGYVIVVFPSLKQTDI